MEGKELSNAYYMALHLHQKMAPLYAAIGITTNPPDVNDPKWWVEPEWYE